jgi:hypothetical protein
VKADRENVTPTKDNIKVIPNQSIGKAMYSNNFKKNFKIPLKDDYLYKKKNEDN